MMSYIVPSIDKSMGMHLLVHLPWGKPERAPHKRYMYARIVYGGTSVIRARRRTSYIVRDSQIFCALQTVWCNVCALLRKRIA